MTNMIAFFKEYGQTVKKISHDIEKFFRAHGVVRVYDTLIEQIRELEELFDEYKKVPETNEDKKEKIEKIRNKARSVHGNWAYRLKNDFRLLEHDVKILQERNGPEYYNKENALKLFEEIGNLIEEIVIPT